jgi:hypothetical protein
MECTTRTGGLLSTRLPLWYSVASGAPSPPRDLLSLAADARQMEEYMMLTLAMIMDMDEETLNVAIERYCYGVKWKRVQDVWCQGRHYHAETLERGWWMHEDQDPHQPPSGWHPELD